MEAKKEKGDRDFSFFRAGEILPPATGSLRMAPILRLQEIQGASGGERMAKEKESERQEVRAERRRNEEERASEIREEGRANRANGQVAYLWRPYFRYMNWFPSKVRDAASFQFKMYREVSRRSPSNEKICEGSPSLRAIIRA